MYQFYHLNFAQVDLLCSTLSPTFVFYAKTFFLLYVQQSKKNGKELFREFQLQALLKTFEDVSLHANLFKMKYYNQPTNKRHENKIYMHIN